jgi:type I restriction enzyme, R subunit
VQVSPNFAFLKAHDLQLVRLGAQAERYFAEDPNTCLRQLAEELLRVAEAEAAEIKAKLIGIQAQTVAQKAPVIQQSIANAQQNGRYLDLDERETLRLIDAQLRSAGWEADTEEIRYSRGRVPLKGVI